MTSGHYAPIPVTAVCMSVRLYVTLTLALPICSKIMSVGAPSGNTTLQVGRYHDAPHCCPL